MLIPKLFTTLKGYSLQAFSRDLGAGVIVGIVALPLAIAFAIASGVTPEKGLITAVVAGCLISMLGGSKVQIGGPTGAFVVIVYGVGQRFGIDGLIVTTFCAGVVLVIFGLARFGAAIKFIPAPVITGFTSGIAVIILTSEIPDLIGFQLKNPPGNFLAKWSAYASCASGYNPNAIAIALLTIAILIIWPKFSKKIPSPFVALILTTAIVSIFHVRVETIGSRFGEIPNSLPAPHFPAISFVMIKALIPSIFTVAVLAAVESLLSAVVADGMIGSRHRSNMELVAQGIANMGSAMFGGIPATGAVARTATNIKSGGRTPVAGIIHSITLLLIMIAFGHFATLIPLASLAGILGVVAYNMSEWRSCIEIFRAPKSDIAVLLTTFMLTVIIDLTVAIEAGMIMASFLFMRRMAEVSSVNVLTRDKDESEQARLDTALLQNIPQGVMVFELSGALFFGAVERFTETFSELHSFPKVLILRLGQAVAIDASGLKVIRDVHQRVKTHEGVLVLTELHAQPFVAMERSGLLDLIGRTNVYETLKEAIDHSATSSMASASVH